MQNGQLITSYGATRSYLRQKWETNTTAMCWPSSTAVFLWIIRWKRCISCTRNRFRRLRRWVLFGAMNPSFDQIFLIEPSYDFLFPQACSDEKWGDWRPHLAMMLSNPTTDSELDKSAIITLGDSLGQLEKYCCSFSLCIRHCRFSSFLQSCFRG